MKLKSIFKQILSAAVSCSIIFSMLLVSAVSASAQSSLGVNVQYHSKEEIAEYLMENDIQLYYPVLYKEEPSLTAPYSSGELTEDTLNSALDLLNAIRYIAGISYDLELDSQYNDLAQAACIVNAANGTLSHYPNKPEDMDDSFFEMAEKGCGSSNIAAGYGTLNNAIMRGWLHDGDANNIDRLGHRRWMLNPKMKKVGLGGVVNAPNLYRSYFAMYVFDRGNLQPEESGVAWPAQNTPVSFFPADCPWSVSTSVYLDISSTSVTLTRLSDNKVWSFSSSSADGDFYVNNDGYGSEKCIIFRPSNLGSIAPNDTFEVSVTTSDVSFSYNVSFFDVNDYYPDSDTSTDSDTDTDSATDSETNLDTDSATDSETNLDTDSATDSETNLDTDSAADGETDIDTDSATDGETDLDTDSATDSETNLDTDSATDSETNPDTDSAADSETNPDTDSATDGETNFDTDSDTESETDFDTDSDTDIEEDGNIDDDIAKQADINGDGKVSLRDASLIQRYSVALINFDLQQLKLADVNNDLKVQLKDAYLLQRWITANYT